MKSKQGKKSVGEKRRTVLIEATIHSLAEYGIAGTTIRTICEMSDSSRGLISHYFGGKDGLMAAALCHLYESVSSPVREETNSPELSPTERLRKLPVVLFSKTVFSERNRSAFLCLWHETRFNKVVRETNQELYRGYVERMESMFRAAAKEKGISIDTHLAAIGFIGLSDGLWLGMSIHDTLISRRKAVNTCLEFIDNALQV